MDLRDVAVIVGFVIVLVCSLVCTPQPRPASKEQNTPGISSPSHEYKVPEDAATQTARVPDVTLPYPPTWAVQAEMDPIFLPMAPIAADIGQGFASPVPTFRDNWSIMAVTAVAATSSPSPVETSAVAATSSPSPRATAPAAAAPAEVVCHVQLAGRAKRTLEYKAAPEAPTHHSPRPPVRSPAAGSMRPPWSPAAGSTRPPWSPSSSSKAPPLPPPSPTVSLRPVRHAGSGLRVSGTGNTSSAPAPATKGDVAGPISPVSVLLRAAEFEQLCRSLASPSPASSRYPSSKSVLTPSPSTDSADSCGSGGSEGDSCSLRKNSSSGSCSSVSSGGTDDGSVARTLSRVTSSAGGGSIASRSSSGDKNTGCSSGGAAGVGFLALARATQLGATASPLQPTPKKIHMSPGVSLPNRSSPNEFSPSILPRAPVKRLAKPNMPSISGL